MSGLVVERATPLCQLQDAGRFGVRHLGVTQGGALDWVAMGWANWLLGNPLGAPVVEVALGGLRLLCQRDACLALAGADLQARLDDQPLAPWRHFAVRRGQVLDFAGPRLGARAYLAAPGGFLAPAVLGSCATVVRESLGGLAGDGRPLQAGDTLDWQGAAPVARELPAALRPDLAAPARLDLVVGAQIGGFDSRSLFDAFNADWTLDTRGDRMGVRLQGPVLGYRGEGLVSEGIPPGAVQVPPDGQPFVLLNDRQTIGGYPRLGALTPLGQARLAQCLPGETLRLRARDADSAQREHRRYLERWRLA